MLPRSTIRLATRGKAPVAPSSARNVIITPRHHRLYSTGTRTATSTLQPHGSWSRVAVLAGLGVASWAVWQSSPAATPLRADASTALPNSATSEVFVDPTTATLFPHRLTAPDGTPLRLVGTGVRTVSFLNIRVYTAAFYVSERELDALEQGTLGEDWIGFTPERLIAPHAIPSKDERAARPHGEALMETLLEKADAAVIIIPLRNTSLAHLRDGFSRALVARMKVPRVSNEFTDSMNEATGAALVDFKGFFPARNLAKGMPLELYYSARNRDVTFQLRNEKTRSPEVLGTLRDPILARELIVSYFSDSAAPSRELVKNTAMGLARERGSPTAPAVAN